MGMSDQKEIQKLLLQRLRKILSVADMELRYIKQLIKNSRVTVYPPESHFIIKKEKQELYYYLLDGKISISSQNCEAEELGHESVAAKLPLAESYDNDVRVDVVSKSMIIRLNRNLFDVLALPSGDEQIDLVESDDPADQFFPRIYHEYLTSELELPSLPGIAVRIKNAINAPNSNIGDVSRILQSDSAIVGSIIQLANSVMYRGVDPIADCQTAINRLGLTVTRNMVISLSLNNMFAGNRPGIRKRMADLWKHSAQVATLSSVLCKQIGDKRLNPDRALLAGLVHDVGTLTILAFADKHASEIYLGSNLNRAIKRLRAQIGAMVISRWGLGADLIEVALEADNWDRDTSTDIDYADIVIVAQLMIKASQNVENANHEICISPAWKKFPFTDLESAGQSVIQNARKELDELMKLLGSYG